jgi:hypothetical protein
MKNVKLVGFIHQYGDNDFSLWGVQLTEEDEMAIEEILDKYRDRGISVRGDAEISVNEVL